MEVTTRHITGIELTATMTEEEAHVFKIWLDDSDVLSSEEMALAQAVALRFAAAIPTRVKKEDQRS